MPPMIAANLQSNGVAIDASGEAAAGCTESGVVVLTLKTGRTRVVDMPQCGSVLQFVDAQTILTSSYEENSSFLLQLLDLNTGRSRLYRRFTLTEPAGTTYINPPHIARDLQTVVYSRAQDLSDLFVVSGLR